MNNHGKTFFLNLASWFSTFFAAITLEKWGAILGIIATIASIILSFVSTLAVRRQMRREEQERGHRTPRMA